MIYIKIIQQFYFVTNMNQIINLETLKTWVNTELPNQDMVGKELLNIVINDLQEIETISKIKEIVLQTPNDMELGEKIRTLLQ